jgi:type IV pilus assembly protein PilX
MATKMTTFRVRPRRPRAPRRQAQRGVIMILTLIALVLLLISVAAMVRSTDTATAVIGNLAFRRDLTNRAEVAIAVAKASLNGLSTTARSSDVPDLNYSATRLDNATGIGVPARLVSDASYNTFRVLGYKCLPASCVAGSDGVLTRWVIDRQCSGTNGTSVTFGTNACGYKPVAAVNRGSGHHPLRAKGASTGLFRISVRVTGPRNTEAYIQTTAG